MTKPKRPTQVTPKTQDNPDQSRLFIKKAREIGADEEKSRADELIGRIAKEPPETRKKPPQR